MEIGDDDEWKSATMMNGIDGNGYDNEWKSAMMMNGNRR
jgi:hypothetical protein